jgi:hypothetical protein
LKPTGVASIVVLGTALRMAGLSFGLPYHHHWDEWWIVDSVLGMVRRHDTVPGSYQYGQPLMWLTEWIFLLMRRVHHSAGDLTFAESQSMIYLAGRLATSIVSSTGTLAVYVAARHAAPGRWSAYWRGLVAALLYATSSELVLHARYAVTDACLAALTAWTLAFASLYIEKRRPAWGAACVAMAGVTCAFKAPGLMTSLIPILSALYMFRRPSQARATRRQHGALLPLTIPAVAAIYVLLNPHVVDRTSDALRDLVGRYKQTRDGGFSVVYLRTPGIPHLWSAVTGIVTQFASREIAASLVISAVSAWGLLDGIRRRSVLTMVASAYAVCLVLSVALPNRTFLFRNYLVVVPTMCIGFGNGVVSLTNKLLGAGQERSFVLLRRGCVALAGLGLVAIVGIAVHDAVEAQRLHDDPRVRAMSWVAAHEGGLSVDDVALTPSVVGKLAPAGYAGIERIVEPATLTTAGAESKECPPPPYRPKFVIDASYRDARNGPRADPWQEQWYFRQCPGYEVAAEFDASPYEINVGAYPTWPGRVAAIVLRRQDGAP